MNPITKTVVDFLQSYDMNVEDVGFLSNLEIFLHEMELGLEGRESTLEMIPTFLSAANEVPSNTLVIVADAGGTNFRVASIYFDEKNSPVIQNLQKFTMPGVKKELSSTDFFEAMAVYFKDVLSLSDRIGFCFSYPVQMHPNKDGELIRFSKEIKAPEVVGQRVGENLTDAIVSMGFGTKKKIVILNDTVATLLAGVGYQNRTFSSYIGFILGTGTNTCYVEQNTNISKQGDLVPEGSMIINVESGGMGSIHRGKLDIMYDDTTVNPGVHQFEKMISGAYLGPLIFLVMEKAADDGLLSAQTAEAIKGLSDLETKDVDDFLTYPYGDNPLAMACRNGRQQDAQILFTIADRLIERAGKLAAINLSAVAIRSGQGTDPTRPICIVADGTTFYELKGLRPRVEFYLKQHLEDQRGIYTEIISVDNAPLIGAAIAGLTN